MRLTHLALLMICSILAGICLSEGQIFLMTINIGLAMTNAWLAFK